MTIARSIEHKVPDFPSPTLETSVSVVTADELELAVSGLKMLDRGPTSAELGNNMRQLGLLDQTVEAPSGTHPQEVNEIDEIRSLRKLFSDSEILELILTSHTLDLPESGRYAYMRGVAEERAKNIHDLGEKIASSSIVIVDHAQDSIPQGALTVQQFNKAV